MGEIFIDRSAYLLARRGSKPSLRVVLDGFVSRIDFGQPVDPDMLALVVRHARWRLSRLNSERKRQAAINNDRWYGVGGRASVWAEFLCAVARRKGKAIDADLWRQVAVLLKADLKANRYSRRKPGRAATPNLLLFIVALEVYDLKKSGLSVEAAVGEVAAAKMIFGGRPLRVTEFMAMAAYKRHHRFIEKGAWPPSMIIFD